MKRSSSTTPKTVKIDERFLSSPRQQKQQQQIQESNLSNYHQIPIQLASPLPPSIASTQGYFVQYSQPTHPPSLPLPPTPSYQQYHPSQPQLQPQPPQPPQLPQPYHNHPQHHQQQQISNSMQSMGHDNTRNIYIQHIHLARHMLKKKLKAEGIDLTQPPYSDEVSSTDLSVYLSPSLSLSSSVEDICTIIYIT
ncbi:unnamed protein product [Trichobilharzia regenti]|nr:unnamed protein product [Trichobilharzia regenti]